MFLLNRIVPFVPTVNPFLFSCILSDYDLVIHPPAQV